MRSRVRVLTFLATVTIAAVAQNAQTAVFYWDANGDAAGTGGSGTWNIGTPSLWRDGSATGPLTTWPTSGIDNDAYFGGTAGTVTIAAGGVTANDLTFATTGYAVTADTLTLNGTTSTVTVTTGTSSIGSKISGSANLTKAGLGTLALSGANDYTGVTHVAVGILNISNSSALGTTVGGTTVANGARLELSGGITVGDALSITGRGDSGFTSGALANVGGDNTWTGNITTTSTSGAGSTRILVSSGRLTISGNVNIANTHAGNSLQGNGTLVVSGNITGGGLIPAGISTLYVGSGGGVHLYGTTILSGNNTYSGPTEVGAGTLLLTRAAALPRYNESGAVIASVARAVDKPVLAVRAGGAGEWTASEIDSLLANAAFTTYNSAYLPTFGIEVTSGNAFTYNTAITNTGGAKNLVKVGGGMLTLGGASSYTGTTTVSEGVLRITHNSALGTTAGGTTVANGARLELSGGITVGDALSITGRGTTAGVYNLGVLASVGGNNTWSGNITTMSTAGAGNTRLLVSDGSTLTISGNVIINNAHYSNSLQSSGTLIISGNVTGGESLPDGMGALYVGSGGGYHHGTTILSGTNTYSGKTEVGAGTLLLTRAAALPGYDQAGAVVASVGTAATDRPILAVRAGGAGEWIASEIDSLLAHAAFTTTQAHLPTFGIEVTSGNTFTYDTAITTAGGDKNFVKLGGGTLTLGGDSNFNGTTTVSQGVLKITHDSALGSTTGGTTVPAGARLELAGGITVADALSVTGRGTMASNWSLGALASVSGNNTWTGNITSVQEPGAGNTRILVSDGSTLTISGNLNITNNEAALALQGNGTFVISGNITGGGNLPAGSTAIYKGSGG